MKVLAILSDAFGGHGGIAKFNRDLLVALSAHPDCEQIVSLVRRMPNRCEPLPHKLMLDRKGIGSKLRFLLRCLIWLVFGGRFDLVICGHIHLLPFSWLFRLRRGSSVILVIHGTEAWQPTSRLLTDSLAKRANAYVSVSSFTRDRFIAWSNVSRQSIFVLPNCVDLDRFVPGPKDQTLANRYGLIGKKVLLTLGRLDSRQKAKGFDQVIEALPPLTRGDPDVAYLVAGDGDDRSRLEKKARDLGVSDVVVFAGYIDEEAKPAHYRLADLYVMPSRGEGFGIVYLEALACGIPVVGGAVDGSREALLDGSLGALVVPDDRDALVEEIKKGLKKPKGTVAPELERFSERAFQRRLATIIDAIWQRPSGSADGQEKN